MSENGEIKKRKLTLNRETLTVMSSDELANVAGGGAWSQAIKWTIKGIRYASEVFGITSAAKEGYDAIKSQGGGGGQGGGKQPAPAPRIPASRQLATPGGCTD
jgi:hypothetical protein